MNLKNLQKRNIPIKKLIITVAFLLTFVGVPFFVSAQTNQTTYQVLTVATVNIHNANVVEQSGNNLKLSFSLYNREGVQPQIKYGVIIVENGEESQFIIDQKVYDEIVNLGEGDTVDKEVNYIAPNFLNGTYEIVIEARNSNGLLLGIANVGEVTFSNENSNYIEIVPGSCYLTIKEENPQSHYTISQGVDVSKDETLISNCKIKNHYKYSIDAAPYFENYYHSRFGDLVSSQKQLVISIQPGEEKEVILEIPKAGEPQAYDAVFSFHDENNNVISNSVALHYVIQGQSATIQNLRLDKNYYQKGEVAKITFNWSASADSFPGSRGGTSELGNVLLNILINDSNGEACSLSSQKEVTEDDQLKSIVFDVSIIIDCINPKVSIEIKDADKNILDHEIFELTSKNVSQNKNSDIWIWFLIGAIFIVVIFSLILLAKKRNTDTFVKSIFFILIITTSFFSFNNKAMADTFFLSGAGSFTVNMDKSSYAQGEIMNVTTSATTFLSCGNYTGIRYNWLIKGAAPAGTYKQTLLSWSWGAQGQSGYKTFSRLTQFSTAHTIPGNYNLAIDATARYYSYVGSRYTFVGKSAGSFSIPYTISGCIDVLWSPGQITVCSGTTFTQTSNCGATKTVTGTKSCNGPPVTPSINCPSTSIININSNSTASATDPDGNALHYGYDWDNNSSIDQYMPSSGYVNSGTSQTATHSWTTTGNKTIKVQACDSNGSCSGWGSCATNVVYGGCAYGYDSSGNSYPILNPSTNLSPAEQSGKYHVNKFGTDSCFGNSGGTRYLIPLGTENEFNLFLNAFPNLNGLYKSS